MIELVKNGKAAMLAFNRTKRKVDYNQDLFLQPKLDGVRCLFTREGAFSRNGKQFMNVAHIEAALSKLFQAQPDLVLDGELYNHGLKNDFEKIISLVRKQKPTADDVTEAQSLVQFHWYDIVSSDLKFAGRNQLIQDLTKEYLLNRYVIHLVKTIKVNKGLATINYNKFLKEGYEGAILRTNQQYENKRSDSLIKFKDFHDTEATIIDVVEGKGKLTNAVGKFIMQDEDGNTFGCPMGMHSHPERRLAWTRRGQMIGKVATFEYFERTKAGSYRHPLFKTIRNYE